MPLSANSGLACVAETRNHAIAIYGDAMSPIPLKAG
jgi:hypothetical protein